MNHIINNNNNTQFKSTVMLSSGCRNK